RARSQAPQTNNSRTSSSVTDNSAPQFLLPAVGVVSHGNSDQHPYCPNNGGSVDRIDQHEKHVGPEVEDNTALVSSKHAHRLPPSPYPVKPPSAVRPKTPQHLRHLQS